MKRERTEILTAKRLTRRGVPRRSAIPLIAVCVLLLAAIPAVGQNPADLDALKETIKNEILQELRGVSTKNSLTPSFIEELKEEIKRELLEEMRRSSEITGSSTIRPRKSLKIDFPNQASTPHPQAVQLASSGSGDAEGFILRNGVGLSGCEVKLVTLSGTSSKFRGYTEGAEYFTVTDVAGKYRFQQIPVANYKLKWQLPGDTGWIRRLWDRPDVQVKAGQLNVLKPVETSRRPVSP